MTHRKWTYAVAAISCLLFVEQANAQFGSLFSRGPKVPEISVQQLRKLQLDQAQVEAAAKKEANEPAQPTFVLIDVRSDQEQAVSIIPGAITKSQFERDRDRYRGRTVVTYCTVGGRSHTYAQQLIKDGSKALNFKGSILGWCQAKLPLETLDGDSTNRVHIFSSRYKVPAQYKPEW